MLKDNDALWYLQKLHEKYIVIPVGKTAQNIAVTCKTFYVDALIIKELGLTSNNGYIKWMKHNELIINRDKEELKDKFNMSLTEKAGHQNFPSHRSSFDLLLHHRCGQQNSCRRG